MGKRICMVGLGYIGLPTAVLLSNSGHQVLGIDVNGKLIDAINSGSFIPDEPGLKVLLDQVIKNSSFRASNDYDQADYFIIAVPTPIDNNFHADLSFIEAACCKFAKYLKSGDTVIIESTSPVATTEHVRDMLAVERPDLSFPGNTRSEGVSIAYCPERIIPGKALEELVNNSRVVGGISQNCAQSAVDLYKSFAVGTIDVVEDAKTAEFCKLIENSYRDVNIAFANEISIIADNLGINVWSAIKQANKHPRVNILNPGAGVGGHCIAVDPWFIVQSDKANSKLIKAAREVNDSKVRWVVDNIKSLVEHKRDKYPAKVIEIALMGLSFKPDVSDLRNSPALEIAEILLKDKTLAVKIIEPNINSLPLALADAELLNLDSILERDIPTFVLTSHSIFVKSQEKIRNLSNFTDFTGAFK